MILLLAPVLFFTFLLLSQWANAQVASFGTASQLRTQTAINGIQSITNGQTSMNDGKAAIYVYSDTSTQVDDGLFVLKNPNVSGPGRWIRVIFGNATIKGLSDSLTALRNYTQSIGKTLLYNKAGLVSAISKRFTDTFSISSSTPTINLAPYLSAMGCSNFSINAVTGFRAGANATTAPNVAVSAITSNSISLVFSQTNTATVSVVGVSVLAGLPAILTPDPGNVKAIISFDAW